MQLLVGLRGKMGYEIIRVLGFFLRATQRIGVSDEEDSRSALLLR